MGFEIEAGRGAVYAAVPFVGELWVESDAQVRGRWWADLMMEGGNLHLYCGKRHTVLCLSLVVALRRMVEGISLQTA